MSKFKTIKNLCIHLFLIDYVVYICKNKNKIIKIWQQKEIQEVVT